MRHVPALCGTCEHHHTLLGCPYCVKVRGIECPGFMPHPDTVAAIDDREIRELTAFDGVVPLVDVTMADGILQILGQIEDGVYQYHQQDGKPRDEYAPRLVALGAGPETVPDIAVTQQVISTDHIAVADDEFWENGATTDQLVALVGHWLASDPEYPTVAWAIAIYGRVPGDGESKRDVHTVCATDIDGRTYTVLRHLDDDSREWDMQVARGWARLLRGDLEPTDPEAKAIIEADELSKAHMLTSHLMTVTRIKLEAMMEAAKDGCAEPKKRE